MELTKEEEIELGKLITATIDTYLSSKGKRISHNLAKLCRLHLVMGISTFKTVLLLNGAEGPKKSDLTYEFLGLFEKDVIKMVFRKGEDVRKH